jgi:hypothetical protein
VAALLPTLEAEVGAGRITPGAAARQVLEHLFGSPATGMA